MAFSKTILLCEAKRTAIGSFNGGLAQLSAVELATTVVQDIMLKADLPGEAIDEIILGCVLTAGLQQAPARQVAIKSGLPNTVQAFALNKVCSSGLKAVIAAAGQVELGLASAVLAGGMESMTQAPYLLREFRSGGRLGHKSVEDSILTDGLWDPYHDYHMGNAAELCAKEYKLSREEQDVFAAESYRRALDAIEQGYFADEIVPVSVPSRKGDSVFLVDEEPQKFNPEKYKTLRPAFDKTGTVTAANASSINDGACVMIVCTEEFAKKYHLKPLARVVSQGWHAQEPEWFTTAPVGALKHALGRAVKRADEIDLFEINEAFSAVALACSRDLEIPSEKLNISGGAVALGHPIGASGARILTTLLHNLKRLGKTWGAVGICNGGGEATSVVVERV